MPKGVIRKWKRFLMVSCSHGHLADPAALKAVLRFKERWKPHITWHLGDFVDLAACMSGAQADADSSGKGESIIDDLTAGEDFLRQLRPQVLFMGNHEHRLWELAGSVNKLKAYGAQEGINWIQRLATSLKAETVPYDVQYGWRRIGPKLVAGHGYMFNLAAIRDHVEMLEGDSCIIGHLHHLGSETGRSLSGPQGYCTGTLANIPAMHYARRRRATLRWSHGLVYGEVSDKGHVVNLLGPVAGEWRMPT